RARPPPVHRPLRRVPPGRRRGRLRDRGAGAATRSGDAHAGRRGRPDRTVRHAALRPLPDLERRSRLDRRVRRMGEAPRRPRRLGARPRRPGPGRDRRVAPRGRGSRRDVPRDRQEGIGVRRWLVALGMLLLGRGRRPPRVEREQRIVPEAPPSPGSELVVLALFGLAALSATAFIVVYAVVGIGRQTQLLGLSIGLALAFLAAALI